MNKVEQYAIWFKRALGLDDEASVVNAVRPHFNRCLELVYRERGLRRVLGGEMVVHIRPAHRYLRDDLEAPVFHFLKCTLRPGDIVLEVGANVGVFTVALARWVGPTGRVYAFEPIPDTRAALIDHLELNRVMDGVVVCPAAISETAGHAFLSKNGTSGANRLVRANGSQTVEAELTTIDDFCEQQKVVPSLIKIDIEGFEFHALRGSWRTLKQHKPTILVELHPMNWSEIGVDGTELAKLAYELDYELIPLENQTDPLREYGHIALRPREPAT